ncbi:S8 family serine peptidase [Nocardiopsis listeri]|uniref:S8 family serine peptidase n=1 Tax=Nocardiopsis listeri TaxID=53440 RepID=UPI000835A5AC|nr:S8 family serine peptidase [Nocardiopsis listeri]
MTLWNRTALAVRFATAAALSAACAGLAAAPVSPASADTAQPSSEASPNGAAEPESEALPAIGVAPDGECVAASSTVVSEKPWTTPLLDLTSAWNLSEGDGVTVAVLSSGIDADATALSMALVDSGGDDCRGYGTFLAGLIAARAQNGSGLRGVSPGARVLDVPVTNDQGAATAGDIADGIDTAVGEGAQVVLIGAAIAESSRALEAAVDTATEADVLVVAPATVAANGISFPASPGNHPEAVSVAAVGVEGTPVAGSPALDSNGVPARVDLTAPGDLVISVGPGGDGHFVGSGDVVAAGFVAGTAALLRSYDPDLSASDVRERLLATAYSSPYGRGDTMRGSGRVDPVGALTTAPIMSGENPSPGTAFVSDPGPGEVSLPGTMAVVGGAVALILTTVAAGALVPRGRERAWRAARSGERRALDPAPKHPS